MRASILWFLQPLLPICSYTFRLDSHATLYDVQADAVEKKIPLLHVGGWSVYSDPSSLVYDDILWWHCMVAM